MKKQFVFGGVVAALVFSGAGVTAAVAVPAPEPEFGNTVCSVYEGGIRHFSAVQTGARTFDVTVVDMNVLAADNGKDGDELAYVPIPEYFNTGVNTVKLGEHVTASNVAISQSVQTGPSVDPSISEWQIEALLGNAPAPWESATLDADSRTITWTHDIDARSDADGVQVSPNDFFFPPLAVDDATSVLTFSASYPDELTGPVSLIEGMQGRFWGAWLGMQSLVWERGTEERFETPGCEITLAALPEVPVTPEVPEVPEKPVTPEVPEVPEKPVTPETPDEPTKPEEPVIVPLTPGTPSDKPAAPNGPGGNATSEGELAATGADGAVVLAFGAGALALVGAGVLLRRRAAGGTN